MPLPLLDYQDEGAQWLCSRQRFGLHDEMGVGKTATTIGAVDLLRANRGMVIAPAGLRENWIKEFRKFSKYEYRIAKGRTIHDFVSWMRGRFHILVTSYEQATKWAPKIYEQGELLDFIAIDEAHALKNSHAQRTRAILGTDLTGTNGAIEWAQHVWHITGTPMANDPNDIYPFLRMCNIMPLDEGAFKKRYFHVVPRMYGSRQEPRPEAVPELKALIANNSIRRTKQSVGMKLPPIFLTTSFVDGDTEEILNMLREYPGLEKEIMNAIELGGLSFIANQHISTLRRLVGEAKAVPYAHMLLEELASETDKRVVYGIHRDALARIQTILTKKGIRSVIVQGGMTDRLRDDAVEQFQNDPDTRVFIGNIRAAGTGLTLTAACEIDMFESDWTPAGNAQAIMRIHRIGQTRNVRARFITLANSIDETVNDIVARKTASIAQIEGSAMQAAPLDVLSEYM